MNRALFLSFLPAKLVALLTEQAGTSSPKQTVISVTALGIDSIGIQSIIAFVSQLGETKSSRPLNREKLSALAEGVFTKRFDRLSKNEKIAVEDFSQLLGSSRYTKYDSSMEKAVSVIEKHCTFPKIEKIKFFRLALFNFLVGNEDMHLKNFTLIRRNGKVELSPAYDLLNTTIVLNAKEEIALPLKGKKSNLNSSDFLEYFAVDRLGLNHEIIEKELTNFQLNIPIWKELISQSFLSDKSKSLYEELLINRSKRLLE